MLGGWLITSPALLSLALGHTIALIGNILLFACIYLNPTHALEDGSNSTSHTRLPFHFLPELWHCLPAPTPWASGLSCLHSDSTLSMDLLTDPRGSGPSRATCLFPRSLDSLNLRGIPIQGRHACAPSKPLSPLPAARIRMGAESK